MAKPNMDQPQRSGDDRELGDTDETPSRTGEDIRGIRDEDEEFDEAEDVDEEEEEDRDDME